MEQLYSILSNVKTHCDLTFKSWTNIQEAFGLSKHRKDNQLQSL